MVTLILLMGACHPFHELSILFVSLRYNLSTSCYAAEMCQGGSNTIVFSRLKNSILGIYIYQSIISSIVYFLLIVKRSSSICTERGSTMAGRANVY